MNSAPLGKDRFGSIEDPGSCHVVNAGERSRAGQVAIAHSRASWTLDWQWVAEKSDDAWWDKPVQQIESDSTCNLYKLAQLLELLFVLFMITFSRS